MSSSMKRARAKPALLSAETSTNGLVVTLTFSKEMTDPSGKHAQFACTVAGSSRAVTGASLNVVKSKIDLTLGSAAAKDQTILLSYTAGDIHSADSGYLSTFLNYNVTNKVS